MEKVLEMQLNIMQYSKQNCKNRAFKMTAKSTPLWHCENTTEYIRIVTT